MYAELSPSGAVDLAALIRAYEVDGPWVRASFVTTLDGRAAGPDGRSGSINSKADQGVFHVVRALADAVVLGAQTVRAEGYGRLRTEPHLAELRAQRGLKPHPWLVILTRSGHVPEAVLDDDGGGPVLVLTGRNAADAVRDRVAGRAEVVACGSDGAHPAEALAVVRQRCGGSVVLEGGPHVLGAWSEADLVDELCLTVRPLLSGGDAPRILEGVAARREYVPVRAVTAEGDIMGRWVRSDRAGRLPSSAWGGRDG